mmetsp:Transcript_10927/g.18265  ORF Transcript_10927/g.18265 Transcript_10927/m.18265 type:complete len:84 (+) Transcript_10927:275-526(+)
MVNSQKKTHTDYSGKSKNKSIEHLENVLKKQRERLDNLQASHGYMGHQSSGGDFNDEKSELLDFELSKASTVKRAHGGLDSNH